MAATVLIRRYSGASGGPTIDDTTSLNVRYNTSDTHATSGTSTPIPIPNTGSNYSFWVAFQLDATVTPAGTIDNIRFYSDGSDDSPAGVSWKVGEATAYEQATGTDGETGDELSVANYASLTGAPADLFDYDSTAPLSITGDITNPSTGPFGDWFVLQMEVASTTAASGATTAETFSVVYDES